MDLRITEHPILPAETRERVEFYWQGQKLTGYQGETVASALFAHGIRTFGHHPKDDAPQGIFCANGQCAQCLVLADGKPVKSCMERIRPGLRIEPAKGLPELPPVEPELSLNPVKEIEVAALIIGGGPSGLSAAIELAQHLPPHAGAAGPQILLIDDKPRLGGKLVLQTHRFFGSVDAVYAGTRGIDIATKLEAAVREQGCVDVWANSTALAVYSDGKVGILRDGERYVLVKPQALLVAAGAREKSLAFPGNTLPGVYGAGAFQTLVNRDRVRAAERLFIVGGGNVGLIAGYHALQAGIAVVGLVEALPECGGYKVHKDKLARMGVPIYTSHTILSANGPQAVESVTIARVDDRFQPIAGTERSFACDTVLIAVGLDPVDEFFVKAQEFGLPAFVAGDAKEIAEASAAIFSGKIKGLEMARFLGCEVGDVPPDWRHMAEILKSRPGATAEETPPEGESGVFPVFHCNQEIPCNPCTAVCPHHLIHIDESDIRQIPAFHVEEKGPKCIGCERCVAICPGLAITLVDYRQGGDPLVTIPYEFAPESIQPGDTVTVLGTEGHVLGNVEVAKVRSVKAFDRTTLVQVRAPRAIAKQIAGIQVQAEPVTWPMDHHVQRLDDDTIVCRCERVTAGEIRDLIRQGYRDVNEIKAVTRAGMGACGAKTCTPLIHRLFREEGVAEDDVVPNTDRPLFIEVPLGVFAGEREGQEVAHD